MQSVHFNSTVTVHRNIAEHDNSAHGDYKFNTVLQPTVHEYSYLTSKKGVRFHFLLFIGCLAVQTKMLNCHKYSHSSQ